MTESTKQTLLFLWGLFLVIICGLATIMHIVLIANGQPYSRIDWALFASTILGTLMGLASRRSHHHLIPYHPKNQPLNLWSLVNKARL